MIVEETNDTDEAIDDGKTNRSMYAYKYNTNVGDSLICWPTVVEVGGRDGESIDVYIKIKNNILEDDLGLGLLVLSSSLVCLLALLPNSQNVSLMSDIGVEDEQRSQGTGGGTDETNSRADKRRAEDQRERRMKHPAIQADRHAKKGSEGKDEREEPRNRSNYSTVQ